MEGKANLGGQVNSENFLQKHLLTYDGKELQVALLASLAQLLPPRSPT